MKKPVNRKLNQEMKDDFIKEGVKIANGYAESKGYKNVKEMRDTYNEKLNSVKSDTAREAIKRDLAVELKDLSLLILKQSIGRMVLKGKYYDLLDRIDDGIVENGNSKQYIETLATGSTDYDKNAFVPNGITKKLVEEQVMNMYDGNGDRLNANSYQYKKELSFITPTMIMYFLTGKLDEYLMDLYAEMYDNYKLYAYVKFCTMITGLNPQKTITGRAGNLWEALNNEILPLMEALPQENNIFNYDANSKVIRGSDMENVIFICSNKIASLIRNGIRTQLFNQELFGASGKLLTPDNITTLGQKLIMGNQDTAIKDSGTEWIDDNTILVIDISGIKHWKMVNEAASQDFASNLAKYNVLHVWGHMEVLKWCRVFKYTNTNLSKLPN